MRATRIKGDVGEARLLASGRPLGLAKVGTGLGSGINSQFAFSQASKILELSLKKWIVGVDEDMDIG
jgi:hypothetical protein